MIFLDCPAYLDQWRREMRLPAQVRCRPTMSSTGGSLGCAMISCPVGHRFHVPTDSLTRQGSHAVSLRPSPSHLQEGAYSPFWSQTLLRQRPSPIGKGS